MDADQQEQKGTTGPSPDLFDVLESEGEKTRDVMNDIPADDSISLYLHEMGREPLLSRQEETELARYIQRGAEAAVVLESSSLHSADRQGLERQIEAAEEARTRFIRANTRLVVSIAKKYVNRGVPFLDLIQEGNLGLIKAVERFDYHLGNRFSTYATWWIRQAISRGLIDQGRTIRIPIHMSKRIQRVQSLSQHMEKQLGRRPTPDEIAVVADIPPREMRWMLNRAQQTLSLEQPTGEDQENELGQLIEDHQLLTPSDALTQVLMAEQLDRSLSALDPREERILRLRFGLADGESYTLEEVGDRLGLTRERIRQIEGHALRRLRLMGPIQSLRDAF